jgi:transketolase
MNIVKKTMRDVFIEGIYRRMEKDDSLMFLSADFGSPKLDMIRADYPDRFINVGIAEQNLVNIAAGMALEGFTVYAYAIAPFLVMRAYEQIRNNLSLLSNSHKVNVNLVGVGAGLSYDVSGPTHHCIEDLSIIRTLPNITIFSPSDWVLAEQFVDYSISNVGPKYIRFDGKPQNNLYNPDEKINFQSGFSELVSGKDICLVSTGYMTHIVKQAVEKLVNEGIRPGVIDVFMIKPFADDAFFKTIKKYKAVITVEEGFINKGGLDSVIANLLNWRRSDIKMDRIGFNDAYVFDIGGRTYLHRVNGMDDNGIIAKINELLRIL